MRVVALLCGLALTSAPQASVDPFIGRWELNVARSFYGGGAEPRTRETFTCTVSAAKLTCSIVSVMARSGKVSGGFTAAYDGKPGVVYGISDADHVVLRKIRDSVADATFMHDGRPVYGYRAVRSSDGQSLTIIAVDPVTRAVLNSVVVYDLRR